MMTGVASNKLLSIVALIVAALLLVALFLREIHTAPVTRIPGLAALKGPDADAWDGKSVRVEGYWHGPFEGISISTHALSIDGEGLLMKPAPRLRRLNRDGTFLERIIPAKLLSEPLLVENMNYVRISGVYRASGYGDPGTVLDKCSWIEFHAVEIWDRARGRWRISDGW